MAEKKLEHLSTVQRWVTQEQGTEPPFDNEFWNFHGEGIYVDVVSGEVLFSSRDKFDSCTGWPSFTKPCADNVTTRDDHKLAVARTEARSAASDSHLGHVFQDERSASGLRYCINSASLRFIAADRLVAEGYGEFASQFSVNAAAPTASKDMNAALSKATLAGGCFWGVEDLIRALPGVIDTDVGYTGGSTENPTYEDLKTGTTGHAEAVQITFDASRISFEAIVRYFFRLHDPTTRNRQGNDKGTQYRSTIFFHDEEQRKIAQTVKADVEASGAWPAPIVTEIVPAAAFYVAESYHQDYLKKNPNGYTCHYVRPSRAGHE